MLLRRADRVLPAVSEVPVDVDVVPTAILKFA
jgi:hypothetical protein